MSKLYELYALESLKDMEPEDFPFSMWLPYVRLNSERFLCKETKEVWHRFDGVTIYSENDDNPEDDLIEDSEMVPEGFVCWHGKKGTLPEIGDVFRVLDRDNQVVFEETISGESILYDTKYASAVKEGKFVHNLLYEMIQTLKGGLGDTFGDNWLRRDTLKKVSFKETFGQEKVSFSLRGVGFEIFVHEHEINSPCKLRFYDVIDGKVVGRDKELSIGDKWYEVGYHTAQDTSKYRFVGWGCGSGKEAAEKIRAMLDKMIDKPSLEARLTEATNRVEVSEKAKSEVERELY